MKPQLEDDLKRLAKNFEKHRAERSEKGPVEMLRWGRPDTITYSIYYLKWGRCLFVTGDMGNAIYQSSANESLDWWMNCGLDYFHGKCEASSQGSRPMDWDEQAAKDALSDPDLECRETLLPFMDDAVKAVHSKEDWHSFMELHLADAFGDEWWEYAGVGEVIPFKTIAHWYGLEMAKEQLREGKAA